MSSPASSLSGLSIGIDLGTTYSAAAYVNQDTGRPEIIANPEGKKITPSVIRFLDGKIIFGSEAEEAFNEGLSGCAANFKRSMGSDKTYCVIDGQEYTAEKLSSMLLKYIKDYAESGTGCKVKDAVITVPAYFYTVEREAVLRAAQQAGIKVKKIIDEPNAAAMAYGLNHWRENANILVYDLGGGTFDVTLIHMQGSGELQTIVTRGDHFLGGRDWDNRLEDILIRKFTDETEIDIRGDSRCLKILRGMSEGIKKQLSKLQYVEASADFPDYGRAFTKISRLEFEQSTSDLLRRTGDFCRSVINEAGISIKDVTDVLLVGGSTRMPSVSEYLAGIFGKNPIAHVNPDESVVLGAAIQAVKEDEKFTSLSVMVKDGRKVTDRGKLTGLFKPSVKPERKLTGLVDITLRETTAHAMGMIAVSRDGERYINDIIIPANHPRPVRAAKAFAFQTSSRLDNSGTGNTMEIFVIQGDKEKPLENLIPFKYTVTGIKHNRETRGRTVIKVQYIYDSNGIIQVEARQDDMKSNLAVKKDKVPADMSKFSRPVEHVSAAPEYLNLVMAVDVSGSMYGEPLEDARNAMCDFIEKLDFDYTRVAVLAVSDRTEIVCGLCGSKSKCISSVKSIKCGQTGFENEAHPFYEIKKILENEDGRNFAIILADGVWENQSKAVKAAKECNRVNIETAAIGFGGADEKFLHDISSGDANAVFVQGSGELGRAFGTIAQSLGGKSEIGGGWFSNFADEGQNYIQTWEN